MKNKPTFQGNNTVTTSFAPLSEDDFCLQLTDAVLQTAKEELDEDDLSFACDVNGKHVAQMTPQKGLLTALEYFLSSGLSDQMRQDLSVVDFDFENVLTKGAEKEFFGVQKRADLTFVGLRAGGDWEYPVAFILYWSGTEFRGFVPQEGNTYNPRTRTAYGSEDDDIDPFPDPDDFPPDEALLLKAVDAHFGLSFGNKPRIP